MVRPKVRERFDGGSPETARWFWGGLRWFRGGLTWRLGGTRLETARLLGHGLGERVAAAHQLAVLITLDVAHPHAHAARLGALSNAQGSVLQAGWRTRNTHTRVNATLHTAYRLPAAVNTR